MGRRVRTKAYQSATNGGKVDGYFDKAIKYIPTDIVGAWIAINGILAAVDKIPLDAVLWVVFGGMLLLTAAWTKRQTKEPGEPMAKKQIAIAIAVVAFAIWVFALGAPFNAFDWYHPAYGSVLLIFFTLTVPLMEPV